MHNPPVKIGENRTLRGVTVILLASAMLLTSLVTLAETASRDQPLPDLGIAQFYSDNNKPKVGETITITIIVKNYAQYAAVYSGRLEIYYDFHSGLANQTWPIGVVGPGETLQPFTFAYNTTGMRGTRHFYADLTTGNPKELNETLGNNNATLEVLVFNTATGFDNIYTGNTNAAIQGLKQYKGFIALFDNANINMQQDTNDVCDIKLVQDQDFEYGIELTGGSNLMINGCNITSNQRFYITIMDNAKLWIQNSNIQNGTIRSLNTNLSATLTMSDTTINDGGIMIGTPFSEITDSNIQGDFVYMGGVATVKRSDVNITKDSQAYISNTILLAENTSFCSMSDPIQILAKDNAQVTFKTIWNRCPSLKNTLSFDATDTSSILIYRTLSIHVADTTDMPIKGATIDAYTETSADPKNLFQTWTSDENGNLTMSLLSDIIVAGPDGYRGNYEFVGTFDTYSTKVTYRLAMHPNLGYNATHEKLNVIFEPVPPKICPTSYKPTQSVINGETLAFTGCMEVTVAVTYVNSTITAIQDKDFQAAIYIEGSGQLILQNTSITSARRMNIYIIGPSASLRTGEDQTIQGKSMIKANAVVGVGGNVAMKTVIINANIRGNYNNFQVTLGSTIRGSWLVSHASSLTANGDIISPDQSSVSNVTGGTLSMGGGEFHINHFEMTATTSATIQNADMWGNWLPSASDDMAQFHFVMPGSSLTIWSNGVCSVINSKVNYDKFEQHCRGFNGEKSTFDADIIYGPESTSGSLKSVTVTSPHVVKVLGDATVLVWFHIDMYITNSLNGPIANAPVTITRVGGSSINPPSSLVTGPDGKAAEDLLAEQITKGDNHQYLGNYKVVVTGCPQAAPFEFSVGMAKGDQHYDINFPGCVPAIEGLQYVDLALNKTKIVPPNNDVRVSGLVKVTYEGGITTPPNDKVHMTITVGTSNTTVSSDTYMTGDFDIPFKMINKGLDKQNQLVTVSASYTDPSSPATPLKLSQTLNITVLPEIPVSILIYSKGGERNKVLEDKMIYQSADTITVAGIAKYSTGTPVPASSVVGIRILGTTVTATGTTTGDGRFSVTFAINMKLKKDTQYMITTTVNAVHPYYNTSMSTQQSDTLTIKGVKTAAPIPIFLIILVVVVIVIVVAVAGIFLYLRMKTWGTVVECGECGAFIPENATKCPKCGTEFETEVVKCSECDAWIPALAVECPKCGVEFKKNAGAAAATTPGGQLPPPPTGEQPAQPGAVAKVPKK
jgi:ribosomal protein L40E